MKYRLGQRHSVETWRRPVVLAIRCAGNSKQCDQLSQLLWRQHSSEAVSLDVLCYLGRTREMLGEALLHQQPEHGVQLLAGFF